MSQAVRVKSIESLREFRAALSRFSQVAAAALMEAELDVQRTADWLEHDQQNYWQGQIRQREERLKKAEADLRSKKIFSTTSMSSQRSFVEEQKLVDAARRQLEEAQLRLKNVKRWIPHFQRESYSFKGLTQGLYQVLESDIPNARAQLDGMAEALEDYTAQVALPNEVITPGATMETESMTRPIEPSQNEEKTESPESTVVKQDQQQTDPTNQNTENKTEGSEDERR